jgi:hypothetical protein
MVGPLLALAFLLGACDPGLPEPGRARIALDLRPLVAGTVGGQQVVCAWIGDEARVLVERRVRQRLPVLPAQQSLIFEDVEAPLGNVRFGAEIRSTSDALLYDGAVTRHVDEDHFVVNIPLRARNPVVQACPGVLEFTDSNNYDRGMVFLNRGIDSVTVFIDVPQLSCDGRPCVTFTPSRFVLNAGTFAGVQVRSVGGIPREDLVQVRTRVGALLLTLQTDMD